MNHGTWIPAGESSWTDIKVPWARYAGTGWYGFEEHHIWIEHPRGTIKYVIWQGDETDGDWVRYNEGTEWKLHRNRLSRVNGNRTLTMARDGSLEMDIVRGLKGQKTKHKHH